ncbi:TNFAIP3-interacting protein 2 isoform X1 [Gadus morhua]|uniref:CCHC NOA-type domain-containing protein n=1 Tax=Gadus morhua TaxID=8049 RepID=A0A8C4YVG5_GADMO|nr:TNFAIP3-interacting protein 2 isoform X1 [Gadus morhua]
MENASVDMVSEVKIRSYNALNTLYHETQQDIVNLNTQLCIRDNVIGELKAKLGKYERISIHVDENEPVLVGPSKSLIESLCQEICKLKKRKNELEIKAARQADASQQEIQHLRGRLVESERELVHLRAQPDHRKDQEIHRLRARLLEQERDGATRAVLCSSLAEEAEQLQLQLGLTIRTCQELMARLEAGKAGRGRAEETPSQQKPEETSEASSSMSDIAVVCQLKEDNRLLKQRVAHVENLNAKWQRYDSSREEYVRVLCHRLRDCSAQASATATTTTTTTTSNSSNTTSNNSNNNTTSRAAGAGLVLLQQEVTRLNGLLADKMDDVDKLGREIEETRRLNKERTQTLEQQVLIYTEDFRWERADRERAQERIQSLQDQLARLQQELHVQEPEDESLEVAPLRRTVHTEQRISPRHHGQQLVRSAAEPSKQQLQLQQPPAVAMAMPSMVWGGHSQGQGELLCPRCQSRYSDTDTVEYLNHCQECANL